MTEDYEKFLATLNTDTTEYLKKYLAVANSYSEINKIFDIKAEKDRICKNNKICMWESSKKLKLM